MSCRFQIILCLLILKYMNADHQNNNTISIGTKKFLVNKLATRGFGRVLTWNVKKLGACLRQDNVAPLKEAVCVVLQSANLIVLQEASNLDFSCLPCNTVLKDEYDWPGNEGNDDFKVLIKTRHSRSFSLKKTGSCETLEDLNTKRSVDGIGKNQKPITHSSRENLTNEIILRKSQITSKNVLLRSKRYFDDASQISTFLRELALSDNSHSKIDEKIKDAALDGLDKESKAKFVRLVNEILENKKFGGEIENFTEQKEKNVYDKRIINRKLKTFPFSNNKSQLMYDLSYKTQARNVSTTQDLSSQDILNIIASHLSKFEKEIEELNSKMNNTTTTTPVFSKQNFQGIMNNIRYNIKKQAYFKGNTVDKEEENAGNDVVSFSNLEKPRKMNIKSDSNSKSFTSFASKKTYDKSVAYNRKIRSLTTRFIKETSNKKRSKEKALKRQISNYAAPNTPNGVSAQQALDMTVMLPKGLQPETAEPEKIIKSAKIIQESGDQRVIDSQTSSPASQSKVIRKPNYVIYTVKSDLNSGEPFILANVKFPKGKQLQRACMAKIASDISNINSQTETSYKKIIAGDFHMDRLSGSDTKGDMYKILTNLQVDGENFHSPLTYGEKDPITTVYGRRFDNIIANLPLKGNLKAIGPDFPLEPEAVVMPFILQRLYNNYMTSLYTSDNDESDSIYECIKAFQMAGKAELQNSVCKDIWTPSSYISDHLPLELRVSLKVSGRSSPVELRLASWNIQGDTFKERLLDPDVKRGFIQRLKKYHMAVFHEFPPHDRILDDQELGGSDIVRLKQGDLTTEFGIYISEYIKDGETDMYILRKKFKGEDVSDVLINPTREEAENMVTTVGLFAPRIVVDTYRLQPCFYTVRTSEKHRSNGIDFEKVIGAIDKDVQTRKCDFKLLMASLNLEDEFDIDKVVYDKFKFINLKCQISDGDLKYKYNVPRSRDLADYIILLEKDPSVEFSECKIGLPGDEGKRGIDKLSDFEELTTHYPFSVVLRRHD